MARQHGFIDPGADVEPLTDEELTLAEEMRTALLASEDRDAYLDTLSVDERVLLLRHMNGIGEEAARLFVKMADEKASGQDAGDGTQVHY
jgi:hypothetical protein